MPAPRHSLARFQTSAFTLLEVILVIGILALLASLLSPSVRNALDRAHMAACASNLRQIAVAANNYASDHDDRLPCIEPDPLSSSPVYPREIGFKGIKDTLADYGITDKTIKCRSDVAAGNYYQTKGTSYEWVPTFNNEPRANLRLLLAGTVVTVPITKAQLVQDWEKVHSGRRQIAYVDGHVEALD